MTLERESNEIRKFLLLELTSKVKIAELETRSGRTFKLCGLIGAMINMSELGITKGPPTANE
jgi:hypothetical protein